MRFLFYFIYLLIDFIFPKPKQISIQSFFFLFFFFSRQHLGNLSNSKVFLKFDLLKNQSSKENSSLKSKHHQNVMFFKLKIKKATMNGLKISTSVFKNDFFVVSYFYETYSFFCIIDHEKFNRPNSN